MSLAGARLAGRHVPEWMYYLGGRLPDETAHPLDDFFTTDTTGSYTTKAPAAGTAAWSVARGKLVSSGGATAQTSRSGLLKSLGGLSAPVTIETAVNLTATFNNYSQAGIFFTDGTTDASNMYAIRFYQGSSNSKWSSLSGTIGTDSTLSDWNAPSQIYGPAVFMRAIWKTTNTFKLQFSIDGVAWTGFSSGDESRTLSPTHFGVWTFFHSTAFNRTASFEYIRVYESDLSA